MKNFLSELEFKLACNEFNKTRESFYEDLAEAITDKESLRDFLSNLRDFLLNNGQKPRALLFTRMLERMDEEEGRLSHILRTIVPDDDILTLLAIDSITKAPERAAALMFHADTLRKAKKMKATVVKAMLTPIMVTPIVCAFAYIISVFFIPEYEKIAPPSKWPAIGQVLYAISVVLRGYGTFIGIGIVVALVAFVRSFASWKGETRAKFDEYLPYKMYRDYNGAKFLVALSSLVNSKLSLAEALELLSSKASPWMAWHIQKILKNMDDHPDDYARAFNTGVLSKEIHQRLSTYARRSSFSDGLVRLGTDGLVHVHESVEKSSTKVNIVAIFGTVFAIMFFYGGNLMISQAIQSEMKKQVNTVGYVAPAETAERVSNLA
jgi:hypothetical protein